jgi:8-oxo-dGTP pyrophosphatase MutT (NUDIX family)
LTPREVKARAQKPREEVSAGGIVFRRSADGVRFLLIRDSYKNWGFPKGHLERGESPDGAAVREVEEETGLRGLSLKGPVEIIDWHFRFRGRLVHKICHFFLIEAAAGQPRPLRKEGITACTWHTLEEAVALVSYDNARTVLARAAALLGDGDGA